MSYVDVDKIKEKITSEDVKKIMATFNCYPKSETNEYVLYPSICHHEDFMAHKAKLYWYKDAKYFLCYSCNSSFDIFGLIQQIKKCTFPQSIRYVCGVLGVDSSDLNVSVDKVTTYDWKLSLSKYITNTENKENKMVEYDKSIINFFPQIYHMDWLRYGISKETLEKYHIGWYDYRQQITIPVFGEQGQLYGYRVRNMRDTECGKYMPLELLNGISYKFPTNQIFYGINYNKQEIIRTKSVILVEGEKTVLKADTWFGQKNICLAMFGSNLGKIRVKQLLQMNVENIYIALDSDFTEIDSDEFKIFEKKVMKMYELLKPYFNVWCIYNNLGFKNCYKFSITDYTREQFNMLWKSKEQIK